MNRTRPIKIRQFLFWFGQGRDQSQSLPSLPSTVLYIVVLRKKRQISKKKPSVIISTTASDSSLDSSPPLPHNLLCSPFSPPQPALPGQAAPSPSSPSPALPGQAALPFVTSAAALSHPVGQRLNFYPPLMVLLGEEALDARAPALDLLRLAPATLPRGSGTGRLPRRHTGPPPSPFLLDFFFFPSLR